MNRLIEDARRILNEAIEMHNPSHIICLFSGGYDSMVATHLVHSLAPPQPTMTYAIDTRLSADGWAAYVQGVADKMGWRFDIYNNEKGFREYADWVQRQGQPYSRRGHAFAYNRLKDRAIAAMVRDHKVSRFDRVLFVSGIRRAESATRAKLESPHSRCGAGAFTNPLFNWSDEILLTYRIEHELPENPFYETVGGSGDCQCNWGGFIDLDTLQQHSPDLACGRVALLDKLSKENHGWGWGEKPSEYLLQRRRGQAELFEEYEDEGDSASPFLCAGCSRSKSPKPARSDAEAEIMIQRELW